MTKCEIPESLVYFQQQCCEHLNSSKQSTEITRTVSWILR